MEKKIDIRIMKLNKWYVPKSFELTGTKADTVVLGYFDGLEVKEITAEELKDKVYIGKNFCTAHPFALGYEGLAFLKREQKKELVDFSSQEQILFLNVGDEKEDGTCFTERTVQEFWNNKNSHCPYFFLSMIHISHSGKLAQALKKIKKVFESADYLSYISYDYCDIVLFAKNMKIPEFMNSIRKLFDPASDPEDENVIFDTFSMVSFYPLDPQQASQLKQVKDPDDTFQATINLSIRDHKAFNSWYGEQFEQQDQGVREELKVERYNLFGRHDISITREEADSEWLMDIMQKLHDKNNQKMFWTFETFIKVKSKTPSYEESVTSKELEKNHEKVKNTLQDEIKKLENAVRVLNILDEDRYVLPVYEVRDCICSIVKNSFAEEFVCCVYESFLHFVSYITAKIEQLNCNPAQHNSVEEKIAECYDKYFVSLNTLVNSTMHNERQFVQATAFNAVFYSVPPKIMAFYNAYIYRIKQILKDKDGGEQYTFLIYPSFSPTIALEQISLDEAPPCDRLLTVTINEKSLYDIESVMYQMVHELAHYVGNDLRCRDGVRKKRIEHSLLHWIVQNCGIDETDFSMLQSLLAQGPTVNDITEEKRENSSITFDYLQYLLGQGISFLQKLDRLQGFQEFAESYYHKKMDGEDFYDKSLEEMGIKKEEQKSYVKNYLKQYVAQKGKRLQDQIREMNNPELRDQYMLYIDLIKSVYRECYADLQMILVLAMEAEDYLNTFLIHQEVPVMELIGRPRDMIRISTVFKVMIDSGIWHVPTSQDNENFKMVFNVISEYNRMTEMRMKAERKTRSQQKIKSILATSAKFDFNNGIRLGERLTESHVTDLIENRQKLKLKPIYSITADLYEYLLEVMDKSLKAYSNADKLKEIRNIRDLVEKILNFHDAVEMFNCVESELDYYKKEGCRI